MCSVSGAERSRAEARKREGARRMERGEYRSVWGAREKREPLVVCLQVSVVPRLIDRVCVFVCRCVRVSARTR